MDGTMSATECADAIINGNRGDARLAIRMHPDPAHFVLDVLDLMAPDTADLGLAIADLRRLLSV